MTEPLERLVREALAQRADEYTAAPEAAPQGWRLVQARVHADSRRRRITAAAVGVATAAAAVVVPLALVGGSSTPRGGVRPVLEAVPLAPPAPPDAEPTMPAVGAQSVVALAGLAPDRMLLGGNDVWVFGRRAGRPAAARVQVDTMTVAATRQLAHPVCSESVSHDELVAVVSRAGSCGSLTRALVRLDPTTLAPGPLVADVTGGDVLVRPDAVFDVASGVLERRDRATLAVTNTLPLGARRGVFANMAADPRSDRLWVVLYAPEPMSSELVEVDLAHLRVLGSVPLDARNGAIPYGDGNTVWVGGATELRAAVTQLADGLRVGARAFDGATWHAFFAWSGSHLWEYDAQPGGRPALQCAGVNGDPLGATSLPVSTPPGVLHADRTHVYLSAQGSDRLLVLTPAVACAG
jgi:hypothetical protein